MFTRPKAVIDGEWSIWSTWGSCNGSCIQNRTRSCTDPEPFNGGLSCTGHEIELSSCYGDDCCPGIIF